MSEEQNRQLYWDAVYKLQAYIDSGYADKDSTLDELSDDLDDLGGT